MDKVIVLLDMDCFYVQVELQDHPELIGKPCVVAQYNQWKGGGLIAVGYEARKFGVKRGMRGDEAKQLCPDVTVFHTKENRGKADLTKYREASSRVMQVIRQHCGCLERASIDEAFFDITTQTKQQLRSFDDQVTTDALPTTFIAGFDDQDRALSTQSWLETLHENPDVSDSDRMLAIGAVMVEAIRKDIKEKTGFNCSAGISFNKMLAKLCCGFHKPNSQTVLPFSSVEEVFKTLPISSVRYLGGKLGANIRSTFNVEYMSQLTKIPKKELEKKLGQGTGAWLHDLAQGVDHDPVSDRLIAKSIGCSKNFLGKNCLDTAEKVRHWLDQLSGELEERLTFDKEENKRRAKVLTVSIRNATPPLSATRQGPLPSYSASALSSAALNLASQLREGNRDAVAWNPPITELGICASKFESIESQSLLNFVERGCVDSRETNQPILPSSKTDVSTIEPLIGVSSVGPKAATGLLSYLHPSTSLQVDAVDASSSLVTKTETKSTYAKLRWDDLDPETLKELPSDIQQEILAELGSAGQQTRQDVPAEKPIAVKRKRLPTGNTIDKYFSK